MTEKLYQIAERFADVEALAAQGVEDGDLSEAIANTLEGIKAEFGEKAQALMAVVENMNADVEAIKREEKRLAARRRAIENRQESLREYLRHNMERTGTSKIECPLFSITLAKPKPMVVIDSEKALPDELVDVHTVVKPDKRKILDALKAGQEVPGAHLGYGKPALTIR